MGWEKRHNRRYYYRKRREGRQVISEYLGYGAVGELAAQWDASVWQGRRSADAAFAKMREEHDADDQLYRVVADNVDTLAIAYLLMYGYHTHKGTWRRYRNA